MHNDVKQHIENALEEVRDIFMRAVDKIESLKVGEKVAGTGLAEDIAEAITLEKIAALITEGKLPEGTTAKDNEAVKDIKVSGPILYSTLRYLYAGYPYTLLKRGATGGIIKLARPEPTPILIVKTPSKVMDKDTYINSLVELGTSLLNEETLVE